MMTDLMTTINLYYKWVTPEFITHILISMFSIGFVIEFILQLANQAGFGIATIFDFADGPYVSKDKPVALSVIQTFLVGCMSGAVSCLFVMGLPLVAPILVVSLLLWLVKRR